MRRKEFRLMPCFSHTSFMVFSPKPRLMPSLESTFRSLKFTSIRSASFMDSENTILCISVVISEIFLKVNLFPRLSKPTRGVPSRKASCQTIKQLKGLSITIMAYFIRSFLITFAKIAHFNRPRNP